MARLHIKRRNLKQQLYKEAVEKGYDESEKDSFFKLSIEEAKKLVDSLESKPKVKTEPTKSKKPKEESVKKEEKKPKKKKKGLEKLQKAVDERSWKDLGEELGKLDVTIPKSTNERVDLAKEILEKE